MLPSAREIWTYAEYEACDLMFYSQCLVSCHSVYLASCLSVSLLLTLCALITSPDHQIHHIAYVHVSHVTTVSPHHSVIWTLLLTNFMFARVLPNQFSLLGGGKLRIARVFFPFCEGKLEFGHQTRVAVLQRSSITSADICCSQDAGLWILASKLIQWIGWLFVALLSGPHVYLGVQIKA